MSEREKLECILNLRRIANIARATELSIADKEALYERILALLDEILRL